MNLHIVVPTKSCVNSCPFCVSRIHDSLYENMWDEFQMEKRIKYAIMNGVTTCVITGTGEPLQNIHFLRKLIDLFKKMNHPFPNVEFQTTGVMLMNYDEKISAVTGKTSDQYYNIELLKKLGVNTISLSVSDIFDYQNNEEIIGIPNKLKFNLKNLCSLIKDAGFNLRLSLNMIKIYNSYNPQDIISRCEELGANQIMFKKLYFSGDESNSQSLWIKENACSDKTLEKIKEYVQGKHYTGHSTMYHIDYEGFGTYLYTLSFGAKVYSLNGISIAIDDDCMCKESSESIRYIIIRENGKLYCRWDDDGSLIF